MKILLPIFFCIGFLTPRHAFYVSITDVEYRAINGTMRIQVKVFTNDLEDDIRNHSNRLIKLQDGISKIEAQRVHEYLIQRLEIFLDGQTQELIRVSTKQEGDAVFSIFEVELDKMPEKLKVTNKILINLFPTQTNIVRLKNKDWKGILKLNKKNISGELSF